MDLDKIKIPVKIEGQSITLLEKHNQVKCADCDHIIALSGKQGLLIKSFTGYLSHNTNEITLKCGKCNKFNCFPTIFTENSKCVLTV